MPALNGSPIGIPSSSTKIVFGLETTYGTEASTLYLLPVMSFDGTMPFDIIEDTALRGSPVKVYNAYQGVGHGEVQLETNFYPEECGYFLALVMGNVTTTGAGAPYTHVMVADPASLSLSYEEQGVGGATIPLHLGHRVGSVSLKFNGASGLVTMTTSSQGKIYVEQAPTTAPADATSTPLIGYKGQVTVNGVLEAEILEAEITFTRDLLLHQPINNSQTPTDILIAPLDVSWSVTLRPTSGTNAVNWRNYYRNFTIQSLQFDFADSFPTSGATKWLQVLMTKAEFGANPLKIDRGDIQAIKYSLQGKALGNSTDGSASVLSPCKVTLKNSHASYTT